MFLDPKWLRLASALSTAIIIKLLLIVGGYYLGNLLDNRWHTGPFLMLTGIVLGMSLGLWWVIYVANRFKT